MLLRQKIPPQKKKEDKDINEDEKLARHRIGSTVPTQEKREERMVRFRKRLRRARRQIRIVVVGRCH